jgi:hypothetical protein
MGNLSTKKGICISNKDPYDNYRIRVYIIDGININNSLQQIKQIITNSDNSGNYKPWEFATANTIKDPYLAEPFLPITFGGYVPDEGQMVKLLIDDISNEMQYVGPYTNNVIEPNQSYKNGNKSPIKKNNKTKGLIPKETTRLINGSNNEQLFVGENQITNRIDFIDGFGNKKNHAFETLIYYPNSYEISEQDISETVTTDVNIDYLLKYDLKHNRNSKPFQITLKLYNCFDYINSNGLRGIKKSQINTSIEFLSQFTNPILIIDIKSPTIEQIITQYKKVLSSFDNKKIPYIESNNFNEIISVTNDDSDITITNIYSQLPNSGGLLPNESNSIVDLNNLAIVADELQKLVSNLSVNQLNIIGLVSGDTAYNSIDNFQSNNKLKFILDVKPSLNTVTKKVITSKALGKPETYKVINVDKMLVNTTNSSVNISTTDNSSYTSPYDRLVDKFDNSYSTIRGENMVNTLIKLCDLFLSHGHIAGIDPRESLIEQSRNELQILVSELKKEIKSNGNENLLNHDFKIS